ncbi:hypothetical protein FB639_000698 [Coemansia asiatica]|nr:hypothetical protein FB639_000698 [Coemansia asiatica]
MVIVILLLTACFLMFFAENDSLDTEKVQWLRKNHGVTEVSPFQNVFFCFYWGFVTITTVGYGDYTPASPWGQVIACITMFMGVFTIVFPTSIISNNFSSEWEAFHKAQKIHEQRMLQQEYQNKKQDLERVWNYANRSYDSVSGRAQSHSPDIDNQRVFSQKTSLHSNHSADNNLNNDSSDATNYANDRSGIPAEDIQSSNDNMNNNSNNYNSSDNISNGNGNGGRPRTSFGNHSSLAREMGLVSQQHYHHHHHFGRTGNKMAPFEYNRMIDITKKVEESLGIPGVSLDQINTDSEVNQNLVVNAMYSKLYNDAFGNLCERMLARLIEHYRYSSVDQIAQSLEKTWQNNDSFDAGPHGKKLTMLEFKLLCFVFERLSQSKYPIPDIQPDDCIAKKLSGQEQGKEQEQEKEQQHIHHHHLPKLGNDVVSLEKTRSSPNLVNYGRNAGGNTTRQRIKSKIAHAYHHLPMSREQSVQSVHDFISSTIAQENKSKHSSKLRFHLHPHASKVRKEDIGSPMPLRRSVSTGIVDPPINNVDSQGFTSQDSTSSSNLHSQRRTHQLKHSSTLDSNIDVVDAYSGSENE